MYSKKWHTNLILTIACLTVLTTTVAADNLSAPDTRFPGGDFTLQSFHGPVSLKQYRGNVVLLFFGYTSCPDVCPMALSILSGAFSRLEPEELGKIRALFVSLDPDRDTPELLGRYTGFFHPNIVGITGEVDVIDQIVGNYGVVYKKKRNPDSPTGYSISHTPDILVVDGEGQLLKWRIEPATSSEDILAYLRRLSSLLQ
ncbi:MAG: SCO family protein [Gammaproteobacteria bacterium]|nr:SCO family protein [Gammaproteobacteria bacterium]